MRRSHEKSKKEKKENKEKVKTEANEQTIFGHNIECGQDSIRNYLFFF